jgi:hypothetical protein
MKQGNDNMSNDQTNLPIPLADDGFNDSAGDEQRVIQGSILRCVDGHWTGNDGVAFPPETKLLALATAMALQHWKDKLPIETIVKKPGQPLPDLDDDECLVSVTQVLRRPVEPAALSGHLETADECPLFGVKQTSLLQRKMSAYDPKRTLRNLTSMSDRLAQNVNRCCCENKRCHASDGDNC